MRLLAIYFTIVSTFSFGQSYFQQEVNYIIQVTLDDKNHILRGEEEFEYVNNSPDQLDKIYIHLWPNAYRDGNSALGKQLYANGEELLAFGPDSVKGNIDSLDFKLNHQPVKWSFDPENKDICIIELPMPIKTGERISISTPFRVKIPSGEISRLGHIDQSYQITQWYPKPAVYDKHGWNPIPYLNQGEFYSEYGSFDVSITLPENYIVGATGDLQTASEIAFMNEKAKEGEAKFRKPGADTKSFRGANDFPPSSSTFKTIRYKQSNVHDFAWFADKRYQVLKGEVTLPHSKRNVTSWALFTPKNAPLWSNAIEYINDGTYYYSLWNGDYPYNNVTAVDGTISAGGGMEYPNVTVIGNASSATELEIVIVHEVGHNWFYGQLGTNERVHGWMDEGMNTHNEVRYMQTKYPNNTAMSDMVMNGRFHMDHLSHHDMNDIFFRTIAMLGEDQPIETHSAEFTSANYGAVMYQKTGLVFHYLMDYLGEEKFDECMQEYYRRWEFKHPMPEDMRNVLEACSGKDLSWLFDDLITTTNHIDYKIARAKTVGNETQVTVKNVGQVNGPIPVSIVDGEGKVISKEWIEPSDSKKSTITLPGTGAVVIDQGKMVPELNRANNSYRSSGLFKKGEKLKFEFLFGDNERSHSNVYWTPLIAGNYYDKLMLGAAFHNFTIAPSKFQYFVAPMYSFGRNSVSGVADLSVVNHPKKAFKLSRFGVSVKSFKHDSTYRENNSYFITVQPYWFAKIGSRNKKAVNYSNTIRIQSMYRKDQFGPTHFEHVGAYAQYEFDYKIPDHRLNVKVRNTYLANVKNTDQFARATVEAKYGFRYLRTKNEREIEIRWFGGFQYFDQIQFNTSPVGQFNPIQYAMSLTGESGAQDLFVDEYYFGRNQTTGLWAQQRNSNMGGFRTTGNFGTVDQWMTSGNVWLELPYVPKVIGGFVDVGAFYDGFSVKTASNIGVGFQLKDVFGVYFPLWMSSDLDASFGNAAYGQKVKFTFKYNFLQNPPKLGGIL